MTIINEEELDELEESYNEDLDDDLLDIHKPDTLILNKVPSAVTNPRYQNSLRASDGNESNSLSSKNTVFSRKTSTVKHLRTNSSNFGRRASSILRNATTLSKSLSPYENEEMLVIYYIAIVIRL